MNYYTIAGITVGYETKHKMLAERSKPYLCKQSGKSEFNIILYDEMIQHTLSLQPELTAERLEYMCIGSEFYAALIERNGFLLHASAVVVDGECYAFSAPSGTGKSTHTSLWINRFARCGAFIINDDKPAIRIGEDGRFYMWGTPFSGKYDISVNTAAPLKAVAFIERAETNSIERMTPINAVGAVLGQTIRPREENMLDELLTTVEKFATQVPVYTLRCNMDADAVDVAYKAMSGKNIR